MPQLGPMNWLLFTLFLLFMLLALVVMLWYVCYSRWDDVLQCSGESKKKSVWSCVANKQTPESGLNYLDSKIWL